MHLIHTNRGTSLLVNLLLGSLEAPDLCANFPLFALQLLLLGCGTSIQWVRTLKDLVHSNSEKSVRVLEHRNLHCIGEGSLADL